MSVPPLTDEPSHSVTYQAGRRDGRIEALPTLVTLAAWLQDKRRRERLSIRKAAERVGVTASTYVRAEKAGDVNARNYRLLVRWVLA